MMQDKLCWDKKLDAGSVAPRRVLLLDASVVLTCPHQPKSQWDSLLMQLVLQVLGGSKASEPHKLPPQH